jgi:hypothetical protein
VEEEEFEDGDGDVVTVDVSDMPYNYLCCVTDSISFSSIAIK